MKNPFYPLALPAALFFLATSLHAQNVGIGTSDPDRKLEIADTSEVYLRVNSTDDHSTGLELFSTGGGAVTDWRIVASPTGSLLFQRHPTEFAGLGQVTSATFTNDGRYRFGNSGTPNADFDFHRSGARAEMWLTASNFAGKPSYNLISGVLGFSTRHWRMGLDGGNFVLQTGANAFSSDSLEAFRVDTDGNLGIGTNNPESRVHIAGGSAVNLTGTGYLQVGNTASANLIFDTNEILARSNGNPSTLYFQFWGGNVSLASEDAGRVAIGHASPQAKLHVMDGTDVSLGGGGELVLGATGSTNLAFDGNEIQARSAGSASPLYVQDGGGDILLVPNETGQVGIGITSPNTMPSDDYLLAVDGKIISEEVRVEMSGSWPDYVFADDYRLMSLDELEEHIVEHRHLPGIPAAHIVETEGIELGDMQRAMMEKIEELTLHVIALKKEIDSLRRKTQ